jgi:hypothetical protein
MAKQIDVWGIGQERMKEIDEIVRQLLKATRSTARKETPLSVVGDKSRPKE